MSQKKKQQRKSTGAGAPGCRVVMHWQGIDLSSKSCWTEQLPVSAA